MKRLATFAAMAKKKRFDNWYSFYQYYVLVFNLIIVVSLLPFGWVYLKIDQGIFEPLVSGTLTKWLGSFVLFGLGGYGLWRAYQDGKKKLLDLNRDQSIRKKLSQYFRIQKVKFIRYEVISFMALIGMMLFQPVFFAFWYLFILFLFSLDWPKYTKVVKHLRLTEEEEKVLAEAEMLPD